MPVVSAVGPIVALAATGVGRGGGMGRGDGETGARLAKRSVVWRSVVWRGVVWRGVAWRGVALKRARLEIRLRATMPCTPRMTHGGRWFWGGWLAPRAGLAAGNEQGSAWIFASARNDAMHPEERLRWVWRLGPGGLLGGWPGSVGTAGARVDSRLRATMPCTPRIGRGGVWRLGPGGLLGSGWPRSVGTAGGRVDFASARNDAMHPEDRLRRRVASGGAWLAGQRAAPVAGGGRGARGFSRLRATMPCTPRIGRGGGAWGGWLAGRMAPVSGDGRGGAWISRLRATMPCTPRIGCGAAWRLGAGGLLGSSWPLSPAAGGGARGIRDCPGITARCSHRRAICHGLGRRAVHDVSVGSTARRGWPACAGHDDSGAPTALPDSVIPGHSLSVCAQRCHAPRGSVGVADRSGHEWPARGPAMRVRGGVRRFAPLCVQDPMHQGVVMRGLR